MGVTGIRHITSMLDRAQREMEGASEVWAQAEAVPSFVRAHGGVRIAFGRAGSRSVRLRNAESGGYRARFPNRDDGACEAVLINTGGGMTGGDHLTVEITCEPDADAIVTTQAAEKIYRSQGPMTNIRTQLRLGDRARLHWLPQEAILFSDAALDRALHVEMAADATLLACEAVYFGRAAMGEVLKRARWRDTWRVRRGGRLIFADQVKLVGTVHEVLSRPAVAAGARAIATVLLVAPDAAERLEPLRLTMRDCVSEFGASTLDGMIVARLLSPDAAALRADLARLATHLTNRPLPRSWQS